MATRILLRHPKTGAVRKGLYGFSWTTFFWAGFPALFRGDIGTGLALFVINILTFGVASSLWAFVYNKRYTLGLIAQGYVFAGSDAANALAQRKLAEQFTIRENIGLIFVVILLFLSPLFVRAFIVQPFKIPSGSMLPTLQIGDHILVNKFIYGIEMPFAGAALIPINAPQANDIIVFEYPKDPEIDYIERVIAVAGDVVEIRDKKIFINDKPFDDRHGVFKDPTTRPAALDSRDNFGPITVPANKIFTLGDNRDNSFDSRFWGFVDLKAVRGKVWIIYWSWDTRTPLFSIERLRSIRWSRIGETVH